MIFLQLFVTFFIIGLFNFGGGGAMISLIQTQVVTVREWISEGAFTDIVAISQSTPGPIGINCATYVGYEVGGVAGSAVATLAVVLPSFLIFLALVRIFDKFHTHPVFVGMMKALHPAVAGLIGAAALILMFRFGWADGAPAVSVITDNFSDWRSWLLFAAAFVAVFWGKANPIYVILAGGVAGLLLW
ncbi:MAG: chromate transporter [Bacteroidales bacterium]|nr:chromate transporter [Candidatus Cryptobacteroides aphodequi]